MVGRYSDSNTALCWILADEEAEGLSYRKETGLM